MPRLMTVLFSVFFFFNGFLEAESSPLLDPISMQGVPVAYHGRFREISAYADLWLYDIYHATKIRKQDRPQLNAVSSEDLVWKLHFFGHTPLNEASLFWISSRPLKDLLNLPAASNRFTYHELNAAIAQPNFLKKIAALQYSKLYNSGVNRSLSKKIELKALSPGLWVSVQDDALVVLAHGNTRPWDALQVGALDIPLSDPTSTNNALLDDALALLNQLNSFENINGIHREQENRLTKTVSTLKQQGMQSKETALLVTEQFPLRTRLQQAGALLQVLPSKLFKGEWYSLHALKTQEYDAASGSLRLAGNFTMYSDSLFTQVRSTYLALENAVLQQDPIAVNEFSRKLGSLLKEGYASIAGTVLKESESKTLYYPTLDQLKAEAFYYQYPLIEISLFLYAAALCGFLIALRVGSKKIEAFALFLLIAAFLGHTIIIGLRCYILNRPPVSNMFETVIYVPWVAILLSLILWPHLKTTLLFIGSSLVAISLLVILKISNLNHSMENVQAVLDSQYWLVIHVMMIVASYGIFALSGILAHLYVVGSLVVKKETPWLKYVAACVLQTLYIGILLLIPGTILGGVWAAQSWGRFWDWDPKESWAFISSCVYLISVHAYRFGFVSHFGLAIGAIIGLMTISFTWYGVNYLLGTGLHSYGFGSGGNAYYYLYLLAETLFIAAAVTTKIIFLRRNRLYAINKLSESTL